MLSFSSVFSQFTAPRLGRIAPEKLAVTLGVTQTSLVNAPKNVKAAAKTAAKPAAKTAAKTTAAKTATAKKTTAAKTAAAKTTTAKKTTAAKTAAAKTITAKKTTAAKTTAAKKPATPASANQSMKVTAAEKKLVETYRGASSDMKKIALKILKGEYSDTVTNLLSVVGGTGTGGALGGDLGDKLGDKLGGLLGNLGGLLGGKK